jgi:SAM-dependent methyltransferase
MTASIWPIFAERFKFDTSPGRPCADDIAIVHHQLLSLKKPLRGLLLGVTKELAELSSDDINITAVDKSPEMIEYQWIGNNSNRTVTSGDWLDLSSMFSNMDFVIGDGVFSALDRKSSHRLMDCVRSVLADDGLFIVRLFCSPEVRESMEHIYSNTTSNFTAFRWRLAQSICDSNFEVCVKDILGKFREVVSREDITHFGWTEGELSTIEVYENLPYILTFMTEAMFIELCQEHGMKIISKSTGTYELSERCPTFVLRKA